MTFLTPLFLLGGLALTLPLWLHLLHRQNPIKLPFSSLMFFERRQQSSLKERRLRYLLLLAARLALYALVALAFARPIWERPPQVAFGDVPTLHLVILDTSLSMNFGDRWERAVREAEGLVERMESADQARIIAGGASVRLLTEATGDRETLAGAIRSLEPGYSRNSFGDAVEAVRNLIGSSVGPVQIHLVSDFQQSSMPGRFQDVALPTTAALKIHSVAEPSSPNWCVETIRGTTRVYSGTPRLEVTVAGFGTDKARKRVTLTINGRQVVSQTVDVPASGRASVVLEGFEIPKGDSRGVISIQPNDSLAKDDQRFVAFHHADPAPILFVSGHRRKRDLLYYKSALESSAEATFRVEGASPTKVSSRHPDRFAFVVVSDVPRLPSPFGERLTKYVEAGGSVLLALGPKTTLAAEAPFYSQQIGEARSAARDRDRFQLVGEIDRSHPALLPWERLPKVKFFRFARLRVREQDQVLARLSDGSPLLVEQRLGEGRVMILASSLDNVWNDLPLHPVFVPFAMESARYLSQIEEEKRQALVDSVIELGKRRAVGSTVQLFGPEGERALSLSESVSEKDFQLTKVGFYEIRRPGQTELVAVNPDARESNLRSIDADLMALWQATGGEGANARPGGGSDTVAQLPPIRIWRWLLALLVVVTLLESVLGTWHLKVRREVEI